MLEVRSEDWVGANQIKRRGKSMCDTSGGRDHARYRDERRPMWLEQSMGSKLGWSWQVLGPC